MSDQTATATAVRRQFKYNGQIIITPEQDPGPEFTAQAILEHLKSTNIFPELGKSEIEIKETNLPDGTVQFEFVKKAGTKGATYCRFFEDDGDGPSWLTADRETMDADRSNAGLFTNADWWAWAKYADLSIEWCPDDEQSRLNGHPVLPGLEEAQAEQVAE